MVQSYGVYEKRAILKIDYFGHRCEYCPLLVYGVSIVYS